jgi:RNA polymerase sigma-70 factor (ECF subfamily)
LDAVRSNARRRRREQEAGVESVRVASNTGALDELLREERRARVQSVLTCMKPRETQLLVLRANGLAYRDLAQSLGVPMGSIGTMLARAEAEFERKYRARYGGEA